MSFLLFLLASLCSHGLPRALVSQERIYLARSLDRRRSDPPRGSFSSSAGPLSIGSPLSFHFLGSYLGASSPVVCAARETSGVGSRRTWTLVEFVSHAVLETGNVRFSGDGDVPGIPQRCGSRSLPVAKLFSSLFIPVLHRSHSIHIFIDSHSFSSHCHSRTLRHALASVLGVSKRVQNRIFNRLSLDHSLNYPTKRSRIKSSLLNDKFFNISNS